MIYSVKLFIERRSILAVFISIPIIGYMLINNAIIDTKTSYLSEIRKVFAIKDVLVTGRHKTTMQDLVMATQVKPAVSVFNYDLKAIEKNIRQLPWVKDVIIKRQLPNIIVINLQEHQAFATWKTGDDYTLISQGGIEIMAVKSTDITRPIIIGKNAPSHIGTLYSHLLKSPSLASKIKVVERVGGRRWNIALTANQGLITIKLPEEGVEEALQHLVILENKYRILDRALSQIDLRILEQITVKLKPTEKLKNRKEINTKVTPTTNPRNSLQSLEKNV